MPRRNLDGRYAGESRRITVRLGDKAMRDLDELTDAWGGERSDVIRRAVQQAATAARRQRREALVAEVPTMTIAELRRVARELYIDGRSRMTRPTLQDAILARLQG